MYKHLQTMRVPRTMALTVLMLMVSVLPCIVSAVDFQYTHEGQTLTYTIIDAVAKTAKTKEGSYSAGNKVSGELIIPSTVNFYSSEYTVVELGNNSFYGCTDLTSVTIPSTVVTIGENAFNGCRSLASATIPSCVVTIGNRAFNACKSLTAIVIPNSVTTIGSGAFNGCSGLTTIDIPNSVTAIWDNAFNGCSGLTTIDIPNSVTTIGDRAFYGCSSLTKVTIPNSVTMIDYGAFENCKGLKTFTIEEGDETIIISLAFSQSPIETMIINRNWAYSTQRSILPQSVKFVTLGNKVTAIPDYAFYNCVNLTNIKIPNTVTTIGEYAFNGSGLTSVTIPGSVTSVGDWTFSNCSELKSLTIEEGEGTIEFGELTTDKSPISTLAINRNWTVDIGPLSESVQSVTLGDNVTALPNNAFENCKELTFFTIPNFVTTIGKNAFSSCSKLMSITIGESVKEIGMGAFYTLPSLERIIALPTTPPTCATNILGAYITFKGVFNAKVYIPEGTYQAYHTAGGWSSFSNLIEMGNITVSLNKSSVSVPEGRTFTLTAEIDKPDDLAISEMWSSSDVSVASVDEDGVLTARKQGTATITLTVYDIIGRMFTASCEVTVTDPSGVEDVMVDGSVAPAEYYNLNGVRVNSDALTPGLYIKRQGGKAEKVLVK